MKKIIFLLLFILFACGCEANYNLEISNNSFKENVDIIINKNEIPSQSTHEEIESDDQITPFLENKYSAFFSNDKSYYEKKVTYFDDYIDVKMNYDYKENEFGDSTSLNRCFENFIFDHTDNSYYIHAYGEFYCLYTDVLNINVKTDNKVIKSNSTNIDGNTYTWVVDESNINDIDIEFEVSKGFPWKSLMKYSAITILLLVIVVAIIYYIKNLNKKNNEVN